MGRPLLRNIETGNRIARFRKLSTLCWKRELTAEELQELNSLGKKAKIGTFGYTVRARKEYEDLGIGHIGKEFGFVPGSAPRPNCERK